MNSPERENAEQCTDVANIPESQLWTAREPHKSRIQAGLEWLEFNEPSETDLDALIEQALGKG
ncbi:hypothetical protein BH24DEI2_BH24DEI2_23460 [soil metagenome]